MFVLPVGNLVHHEARPAVTEVAAPMPPVWQGDRTPACSGGEGKACLELSGDRINRYQSAGC